MQVSNRIAMIAVLGAFAFSADPVVAAPADTDSYATERSRWDLATDNGRDVVIPPAASRRVFHHKSAPHNPRLPQLARAPRVTPAPTVVPAVPLADTPRDVPSQPTSRNGFTLSVIFVIAAALVPSLYSRISHRRRASYEAKPDAELAKLLHSGKSARRVAAVSALAANGNVATHESRLIALSHRDPNESVRVAATSALGRGGSEASAAALLMLVRYEAPRHSKLLDAGVDAIVRRGEAGSVQALGRLAESQLLRLSSRPASTAPVAARLIELFAGDRSSIEEVAKFVAAPSAMALLFEAARMVHEGENIVPREATIPGLNWRVRIPLTRVVGGQGTLDLARRSLSKSA